MRLIHISCNVNAVLKPFFPKTAESKVIRVSSNEGNLPRSEKKKKQTQKISIDSPRGHVQGITFKPIIDW